MDCSYTMRKTMVLLFAILTSLSMVSPAHALKSPTCIDLDEGKNFYQQGATWITGFESSTMTDFCIYGTNILVEHYCKTKFSDGVSQVQYRCPYGCIDGACINPVMSCRGSFDSSMDAYSYRSKILVKFGDGSVKTYTDGCGRSSGSGEVGIQHYFCGYFSGGVSFWSILHPCPSGMCSKGVCL